LENCSGALQRELRLTMVLTGVSPHDCRHQQQSASHRPNAWRRCTMNGAQALLKTLADAGIEVCFTNPGTSEMHFVAALDSEPRMRAVLALFEGVATGAADGYARMADKPAATLLHLGCGLGNGLANLHNARKGKVPVVNIVGDHATTHTQYDAQLQSDIETVARNVSPGFVRTSRDSTQLGQDAVDAVLAARGLPGQVATLILPADVSWGDGGQPAAASRRLPCVASHE
jgi:acetolactate synthase-1/2/3 large subunit